MYCGTRTRQAEYDSKGATGIYRSYVEGVKSKAFIWENGRGKKPIS